MSEVNITEVYYFTQSPMGPVLIPTEFKGKHAFNYNRSRNLMLTGRDGSRALKLEQNTHGYHNTSVITLAP